MANIAILGATGYIGTSLAHEMLSQGHAKHDHLFLFSRSPEKIKKNIKAPARMKVTLHELSSFGEHHYDVIINCTGIGNPAVLMSSPEDIFYITEEIDNTIIRYLLKNKKSLYVNLSSGAVYGKNSSKPVNESVPASFSASQMMPSDYYALSKLYTETKHRSLRNLRIVDLRVFSFFSRFADPKSPFFMSEIIGCLKSKKTFLTDQKDMKRDYITPKDLLRLISLVMKKKKLNDAFDVYSLKPTSKRELLSLLANRYGLIVKIRKSVKRKASHNKAAYFSNSRKASSVLGYVPEFSSLDGIKHELDAMFGVDSD